VGFFVLGDGAGRPAEGDVGVVGVAGPFADADAGAGGEGAGGGGRFGCVFVRRHGTPPAGGRFAATASRLIIMQRTVRPGNRRRALSWRGGSASATPGPCRGRRRRRGPRPPRSKRRRRPPP